MMKRKEQTLFLFLVYVVIPVFFLSCKGDSVVNTLLQEAEAVMDNRPDSAYTILIHADSIGGFNRAQRAEWNLLITQAKDKIKIKPANDSIIREAVDYYTAKDDPHRLMLAHYYMGRVSSNLGDPLRAQDHYLEAREKAILNNDSSYLARINSNVGMLYLNQELAKEALPYLLDTESYFFSKKDSANLRFATRDLGRAYSMLHKPDSALFYYKRALTYSPQHQRVGLFNEIIPLCINQADYDSAFMYVQEMQNLPLTSLPPQSNLSIGLYFSKTNQPDSARHYLMGCLESDNIHIHAAACHYLYLMAREIKDLKNYTLYQTKYEALRDSIMDNTHAEALLRLKASYNYEKKENEIMQAKLAHAEERQNKLIFAVIAIILLLLLGYAFYYMRSRIKKWYIQVLDWEQKMKKQENDYAEQIHLNTIEIEKSKVELKEQNNLVKKFQTKIEDLEQKNKELKQKSSKNKAGIKALFSSDVYKLFQDPNNREITVDEKTLFIQLMDKAYPAFEIGLKELCLDLSEEELFFCYLSKAKISPTATAIIIKKSISAVTNKRSQLAVKIFNKKKSASVFDEEISKIN